MLTGKPEQRLSGPAERNTGPRLGAVTHTALQDPLNTDPALDHTGVGVEIGHHERVGVRFLAY
jgi:hypothetical protein